MFPTSYFLHSYQPLATCHLPLTTYHLPLTTYNSRLSTYHLPLTIYHLPLTTSTCHLPSFKPQLPLSNHVYLPTCIPSHPSSASPLERITPRAPRPSRFRLATCRSSSRLSRRRPPTSAQRLKSDIKRLLFPKKSLMPLEHDQHQARDLHHRRGLDLLGNRSATNDFNTRWAVSGWWRRPTRRASLSLSAASCLP